MEIDRLSTKTLQELHYKYAVDLVVARIVKNNDMFSSDGHVTEDITYLQDKMTVVDMEMDSRPGKDKTWVAPSPLADPKFQD